MMVAFFVVLTIVAFIAVDSVVQWNEAKKKEALPARSLQPAMPKISALALERAYAPEGVFFNSDHTWLGLETSGLTHVGIDDFAQRVIGRIDEVELPEVGREVRKGETLFALQQGGRRAEFTAPIDGVVTSVNESLARHPEAVKADPYSQGWICSLSPKNLARNLKQLFIAEEMRDWIGEELRRFQEFMALRPIEHMAYGRVLQDGGQLTDGVLELMDDETWDQFNREFLGQKYTEEWTE